MKFLKYKKNYSYLENYFINYILSSFSFTFCFSSKIIFWSISIESSASFEIKLDYASKLYFLILIINLKFKFTKKILPLYLQYDHLSLWVSIHILLAYFIHFLLNLLQILKFIVHFLYLDIYKYYINIPKIILLLLLNILVSMTHRLRLS